MSSTVMHKYISLKEQKQNMDQLQNCKSDLGDRWEDEIS